MNYANVNLTEKRVFLIATVLLESAKAYSDIINKHIPNALIFAAHDGFDALSKADNYPPHVFIIDPLLPKRSGIEIAQIILGNEKFNSTAIIFVSELPEAHTFVDEVVTGRVQYLVESKDETKLNRCIANALNFLVDDVNREYKLCFMTPNEILFREGDEAKSVYIVRRGKLEALVGPIEKGNVLGQIQAGEFVGEMAHINGEPRSATVRALSDCELIEIPRGGIDTVLFSKPAWSKALITTLSKRLKSSNQALTTEEID